jgi:anion-transporting  ArsA/GET3 family ATPase
VSPAFDSPIADLLRTQRVVVCCGAGGVGKTTVSASLAIGAARMGRRVLVVTIDPSRRLAETLGVSRNPTEPVPLPDERQRLAGIEAPGSLSAWMLDPQLVSDNVVRGFSKSPEDARRLLDNPIYKNVTAMIAGMQEYTAVEALYQFVLDDTYDLVVLDTPPSRNALRFLEAPSRAGAFLDRRVFNLFLPGEGGAIRRMAQRLLERVMDTAFGADTRKELQQFFELFGNLLGHLNHNQAEMRAFFARPDVGFLLVTSPTQEALTEARYFEGKTRDELGLNLLGYVLNRSLAWARHRPFPRDELLPADAPPAARGALEKLRRLAGTEEALVAQHTALAADLRQRAGGAGVAWILPGLPEGASEMEALLTLSNALLTKDA